MNHMKRMRISLIAMAIIGFLQIQAQKVTHFSPSNSGLASDDITHVAADTISHTIWVTHVFAGVTSYQNGVWTVYNTSNSGLNTNNVYHVLIDGTTKWFATDSGISSWNGISWANFSSVTFAQLKKANWLAKDLSGNLWIATDSGVVKKNGAVWTHYSSSYAPQRFTNVMVDGANNVYGCTVKSFYEGHFNKFNGSLFDTLVPLAVRNTPNSIIGPSNPLTFGIPTYHKDTILLNYTYDRIWGSPPFNFSSNHAGTLKIHNGNYSLYNVDLCKPDTIREVTKYVTIDRKNNLFRSFGVDTFMYGGNLKYKNRASNFCRNIPIYYNHYMAVDSFNTKWVAADGLFRIENRPSLVGNVFIDQHFSNCTYNPYDIPVNGIKLRIQPGNIIVQTAADGSYQKDSLPIGNYTIEIDTTNIFYKLNPCDTRVKSFSITQFEDVSEGPNFVMERKLNCILPSIHLNIPWLRRCFTNILYVFVSNHPGSNQSFSNVTTTVSIDSSLIVDSADASYTQVGNQYTFTVPNLAPGKNHTVKVYVRPNCNTTVIGQTACATGTLSLFQNCYLDSTPDSSKNKCQLPYDNSSYTVKDSCGIDSLYFIIKNRGTGNGVCHAPVTIFVNGVVYKRDSVMLNAGTTTIIKVPKSTNAWSLMVSQHPLHPGSKNTVAHNQNCSSIGNSFFQFPYYNNSYSQSTTCRTIVGSYDPNDKLAVPVGYQTPHYIEPSTTEDIEYTIRFQNTGTDTAFTVVVKDTISSQLDLMSLNTMGISHGYIFSTEPGGVAVWTFPNINLPDSGTNSVLSNGFITYNIRQNAGLAEGTQILNKADIYFDMNPAIVTNTYHHTIKTNPHAGDITEFIDTCAIDFNGTTIKQSTIIIDTLYLLSGADSFVIRNITIKPASKVMNITACDTFHFGNKRYTTSGIYMDTIIYPNTCDTAYTINLTINQSKKDTITVNNHCQRKFIWLNDTIWTSGIYNKTIPSGSGCDTLRSLIIGFDVKMKRDTVKICDTAYTYRNKTYKISGVFADTTNNSGNTCDSIYILHLSLGNFTRIDTVKLNSCKAVIYKSKVYHSSISFFDTSRGICDTIRYVQITINKPSYIYAASGCGQIIFNNKVYKTSGIFKDTILSSCDTIVELRLQISPSYNDTIKATSCVPYNFGGIALTKTGIYTNRLRTINGCDSIIVLNLNYGIDVKVNLTNGVNYSVVGSYTSYQWYLCNPWKKITNATNKTFTTNSKGGYACVVSDGKCTDTSDCIELYSSSIQNTQVENIIVYPNPVKEIIHIQWPNMIGIKQISLNDLTGRIIMKQQTHNLESTMIHVDKLSKGVYILEINYDHKLEKIRIIKE